MTRLPIGLGIAVALGGGCRSACSSPGEPTLEIGEGERAFEPLDETDPALEIIHGTQGGYHVAIALEATHLDGSDLMSSSLSGFVDGVLMGHTEPWVEMHCNPETHTLQSWNNRLIWEATPDQLDGRTARIEVEVTDISGTSADATAEVRLFDPSLQ